jgi:hypothetical protein
LKIKKTGSRRRIAIHRDEGVFDVEGFFAANNNNNNNNGSVTKAHVSPFVSFSCHRALW